MTSPTRSHKWIASVALLLITSVLTLFRANVFASEGTSQLTPVSSELTSDQLIAQEMAMANSDVAKLIDGNRAEVFLILSVTDQYATCSEGKCLQANIYDYDANATISVVVDVVNEQVLDVFNLPGAQPPILNTRLDNLARETIANSQEVKEALGYAPSVDEILMMQSNHLESANCRDTNLCAAAVFLVDGGVVWVMYDANNEQIDKIWWDTRPLSIADRDVFRTQPSDEFLAQVPLDCNSSINVNQDGWTMVYETTNSDSLRVSDIRFNGTLVMTAASLVEWHADYGGWGYRDSTGCFNAGGSNGFPIYPFGSTQVVDMMDGGIRVGFEVVQDFRMGNWGASCNYRYEQRFQFYTDGRYRIVSGAFGEGCGNNTNNEAIYRPVWRLDVAVGDAANDAIETWDSTRTWQGESTEAWFLQGSQAYTPEGYQYKIYDTVTGVGFYIEPGNGQFNDAGTGDNAYVYVTQYAASEGATDISLLPGTGCCSDDENQGPDAFINGESINGEDIVIWYVPQSRTITQWEANQNGSEEYCWTESTTETWPCWSGPMFHPINQPLAVGLDSANAGQAGNMPYLLIVSIAALLVSVSGIMMVSRRNG